MKQGFMERFYADQAPQNPKTPEEPPRAIKTEMFGTDPAN